MSGAATETCPNIANHTQGPRAYLAWHYWASRMARNHSQSRCPSCRLYVIWRPDVCGKPTCPCATTPVTSNTNPGDVQGPSTYEDLQGDVKP